MFEPTEHEVTHDIEKSMNLFERAKIGEVAPVALRRPESLLLVLDGSSQDELGAALAGRLRRRHGAALFVVDARNADVSNELAEQTARRAEGRALEKTAGDSFDQILAAVEQSACDLAIVPCPFGRDLETIGSDSTGTVIAVLLSRSPVPLLVVRRPYSGDDESFAHVAVVLVAENEAARAACGWAAGLAAPEGTLELLLVLERETVENVRALLQALDPAADVSDERLFEALRHSHVRLHRSLQKTAESAGLSYQLRVGHEGDPELDDLTREDRRLLLVVALERADHMSQGHVQDRLRHSPHPVLVVPRQGTA